MLLLVFFFHIGESELLLDSLIFGFCVEFLDFRSIFDSMLSFILRFLSICCIFFLFERRVSSMVCKATLKS